jgi:hypothetical protein
MQDIANFEQELEDKQNTFEADLKAMQLRSEESL